MKITILCEKTSWTQEYLHILIDLITKGNDITVISTVSQISSGDILVVVSFTELIPLNLLSLYKNNITVHSSDLPKGRGWNPVHWEVLAGKNAITSTLIELAEKVDAGDFYLKGVTQLDGDELLDEIRQKVILTDFKLIENFVYNIDKIKAQKQKGKPAFYKKRTANDSQLSISGTIEEQFNLFRIADNQDYPVFFNYKNNKYILKIFKVE